MSNQGGLKHVATEPTRLETKRERRRGAAGRAAALRRAPSDSDCSGETASLSADSGDRAVRPAPQPPPRGKSRSSRRRGSEWEVLEGLKDGQRFEKRPEVFNGYLHKKRKWPLKGWHKRFFVVDGGILVYARSPTDVARGRLHGSVDVGLSVISAKARRRRIDIDADEFIYHLRAKTPDVFRTWLTVLKAHRLYRQHLLTFGARESVPKIHAPLEDLPPTDTSSRTSPSAIEISTLSLLNKSQNMTLPLTYISSTKPLKLSCEIQASVYGNRNQFTLNDWSSNTTSSKLLPLKFDALGDISFNSKLPVMENNQESIYSVDVNEIIDKDLKTSPEETGNDSPMFSLDTTDAERQAHSTDLDISLGSPELQSSILCKYYINTPINKDTVRKAIKEANATNTKTENTLLHPHEPIATYCFSTHQSPKDMDQCPMRRSRKSTNLVKYKNIRSEPPLKKPFNTYLLLGNYSNKIKEESTIYKKCDQYTFCNIGGHKDIEIQAEIGDKKTEHKDDRFNTSNIDKITEKLMMSIFDKIENSQPDINFKSCINEVVKELYDSKTTHNDAHPVIALFKCLLEYWLKNTSVESVRETVRRVKSIDRQSNKYFTKDENTSSFNIENVHKQTQFHGISDVNQNISRIVIDMINKKGKSNRSRGLRINNDSSEKDRRIQEIERILKNTVYICSTAQSKINKKDIKITKTLIDNLENTSKRNSPNISDRNNVNNSNSSSELPKIQDTLNRLISETSMPLDIAKDFLGAYLDILHDSNSSDSSLESIDNLKTDSLPKCDVQTESIKRKASKGIITSQHPETDTLKKDKINVDPGQLYLKSILDNITTIFCKRKNEEITADAMKDKEKVTICSEKKITTCVKNELVEVTPKKSVVLDFSSYNLERVSTKTNPNINVPISVVLEDKNINSEDTNSSFLRLKFSVVKPKILNDKGSDWNPISPNNSNKYFDGKTNSLNEKIPVTYGSDICTKIDLKPYLTSSDATSKDYRLTNSDHSLNFGFQSFRNISSSAKSLNVENDTKSCYILSSLKKCPFQIKKNNQVNADKNTADKKEQRSPPTTKDFCEEISMFENTPRTIDEKFILLLMENLTLLSKSLPAIHKEINALYQRLRKKYDKIIKTDANINPQGLGLLGKIYSGEINIKQFKDNETQYEISQPATINRDVAIQNIDLALKNSDKSLTSYLFDNKLETQMQTDECNCTFCLKYLFDVHTRVHTGTTGGPAVEATAEKAVSNQNWYRRICTKDCGISALMDYVLLGSDSSRNFRLKPKNAENKLPLKIDRESSTIRSLKSDKGHSNKARQDLMKEIKLMSPSLRVSTQSQTEEDVRSRCGGAWRDFKIYELFSSQIYDTKKSSSMFVLTADSEEKSDDLKTLYRCTSDPSYSSG